MAMKAILSLCLAPGFIGMLAASARADVQTLPATASHIEVSTSSESSHYVVEFDVPVNVRSVRQAWLEVRMDVSASDLNGFVDPAPMLEVYMLKQSISGDPDPSVFDTTGIPMSRPVALGTNRLVRLEITEFVQRILADPRKNHGIVMGSLTGTRSGEFAMKSNGFGPGTPVRITIVE
jgi:hypothetical protein